MVSHPRFQTLGRQELLLLPKPVLTPQLLPESRERTSLFCPVGWHGFLSIPSSCWHTGQVLVCCVISGLLGAPVILWVSSAVKQDENTSEALV